MDKPQHKESLIEIGRKLRKARQSRKLSQREVATRLRLPELQVQALEAGEQTSFGALIYLRGYLAKYARLVGLNANKLLAGLEDQGPPPLKLATAVPARHLLVDGVARWCTYVVGTAMLVLPLVWWLTDDSVDKFLTPGTTKQEMAFTDNLGDGGNTHAGEEGTPDRPVLASMAPVRARTHTEMGPPKPPQQEVDKSLAQPMISVLVPDIAPLGHNELLLELSADSWVEIRDAGGERLEYDLLRGGTTHRYQGEAPYQLLLGNAAAVKVRYNKQPFDFSTVIKGNLARFTVGEVPERG